MPRVSVSSSHSITLGPSIRSTTDLLLIYVEVGWDYVRTVSFFQK
jgi:hypothetical protein